MSSAELDPAGRAAVGRELRRLGAEIDALDARAAEAFSLARSDMRCLDALSRQSPLTPGALARAAGMSSGGVSLSLRRLERAGYVTRTVDPADRRRIEVAPTERVRGLERAVFGPIQARTAAVIAAYAPPELALIHHFLTRVSDAIAGPSPEKGT